MRPAHLLLILLLAAPFVFAQTTPGEVEAAYKTPVVSADLASDQLRDYLISLIPARPQPHSAAEWTVEAKRLREKILADVIFHGWPKEWVNAAPKFEDLGLMPSGPGYRMRKLRFEIVPGFYSTAVLYEPEKMSGRMPAVVNVNGHDPDGKAAEYKQKRCINQALMGILNLNLEWINFGELRAADNDHFYLASLDVAGTSGIGLFYLAMRRGLDYLAAHPNADPERLGVTGLSGGGWQTIILSSLDPRVKVAIPVAGFGSFHSSLANHDISDPEQSATDLVATADYGLLPALRAPNPTLLIYNAEDNCCFRGPLVKPYVYSANRGVYALYGKETNLAWHENSDPGTHNYQLDNRQTAYRFLARHFGLPEPAAEVPVDAQIKSVAEMKFGVPADNLTILGLARKLAAGLKRPEPDRANLARIVRYEPQKVTRAWNVANSKNRGIEAISRRLDFPCGLSAVAVWLKPVAAPAETPSVLVLNDGGRKASAGYIADRLNRGEQVVVLELPFFGEMNPGWGRDRRRLALALNTLGKRPLGIQAAQVAAVAKWMLDEGVHSPRVAAFGMRSQVIAQVARALEPARFTGLTVENGIPSLQVLLDKPVPMMDAPELFCPDLYRDFDIAQLEALGGSK
jgi:hypothetical protein